MTYLKKIHLTVSRTSVQPRPDVNLGLQLGLPIQILEVIGKTEIKDGCRLVNWVYWTHLKKRHLIESRKQVQSRSNVNLGLQIGLPTQISKVKRTDRDQIRVQTCQLG